MCYSLTNKCMENVNDYLNSIVDQLEKDASLNDKETIELVNDLRVLLENAVSGRYHDYHTNGAELPKMQLNADLDFIKKKMIEGAYDNKS